MFNLDDGSSAQLARFYETRRAIPDANLVGLHLGRASVLSPKDFGPIRKRAIDQLPTRVQGLALIWSQPFAVGCMSITSAFAAGYSAALCEPGCGLTAPNPLFDSDNWLPADTVGWWPAMMIPSSDIGLARALIERGIAADGTAPAGVLYLVRTEDGHRNVRAADYDNIQATLASRLRVVQLKTPVVGDIPNALGYFTGTAQVAELARIHFVPGAIADHVTSSGGVLVGGNQMSAVEWLLQGATAAYGSVSEPCNHSEKFPDVRTLMRHYLRGDTIMEAYWKSVAMAGQGLFMGEPLARPYATHRR